jgi:dihydrofolate synthase/folylpolyglutamate synthase
LVCSIQKNPGDFLGHLEGCLGLFRGIAIPGEKNTLSAQEVTAEALSLRMDAAMASSVEAALDDITVQKEKARVLIAGSLYLAGTILKKNA